jgi:LmbE family N-acetylglucosaminyl deacetylase
MTRGRILLLIPHPDDEVVGCGAAITRARAAGAELFAIYLTTGIAPIDQQWRWRRADQRRRIARRRAEALRVAARLGLHPLRFEEWPARTLKDHLPEALDRVASILADPAKAIDTIWVPAYEGGHQDHDVTNMLASTLAERDDDLTGGAGTGADRGGRLRILEFAEYNFRDRAVHSHEFVASSHDDVVLVLTARERQLKADLLETYASERGNLRHIEIGRERFRPLARYDYRRPPHPRPLFYERFHWVPFRHPRVDFTSPEEICAAMSIFRRSDADP